MSQTTLDYHGLLSSSRLYIREMEEEDWQFIKNLQADLTPEPEVMERMTEPFCRALVARVISRQQETPRRTYRLVIVLKDTDHPVGWCDLFLNSHNNMAEIGFRVDARYWNKGYATEAAHIAIQYAFDEMGVMGIWGECEPDNHASARVMEKAGMRREEGVGVDACGNPALIFRLTRQ